MWDMHRYLARWALYLTLGFALLFSSSARAWVEWHHIGDEVHVELDKAGIGHFEHALRYRVQMGPLKTLDLPGIDAAAEIDEAGTCRGDDGTEVPVHVSALPEDPNASAQVMGDRGRPKKTLRITVDDPKGLKRGLFTFLVRYRLDATSLFARDGALFRFTWTAPPASEGYDTGKVVLRIPSAPSEPKPTDEGAVLSTLRREASADELTLIRPHVARGEAPSVAVRVDPRAFPQLDRPDLRPRAAVVVKNESRLPLLFFTLAAALGGAALFALLRLRARASDAPLIRLRFRKEIAAVSFAVAIALQCMVDRAVGLVLVLVPMVLSLQRTRPIMGAQAPKRATGTWLALRDADAFGAPPLVSLSSPMGRLLFVIVVLLSAGLAVASSRLHPDAPILVCGNASVLLVVFLADHGGLYDRALLQALQTLRKASNFRVVPWARLPGERACEASQSAPRARNWDELRLRVQPKGMVPGALAIEIACASEFAVLARVREGSPAERKLRSGTIGAGVTLSSGRTAEERVLVVPASSPAAASAIATELYATIRERRKNRAFESSDQPGHVSPPRFRGKERRNSLHT